MIYHTQPSDFKPRFAVASAFLEHAGDILLLHRPARKSQGDRWGLPNGKLDPGETPLMTIVRETQEETGLVLPPERFQFFKTVYVRYPEYDFTYHLFSVPPLTSRPAIKLREGEHDDFQWLNPRAAFALPLVADLGECITLFYKN